MNDSGHDNPRLPERYFRLFADHSYDWETWTDAEGHYLYCSPSAERVTGYPPQAFVDDPGLLLKIVHPDDRRTLADYLEANQGPAPAGQIELRIIHRDGSTRRIRQWCQPVFAEDGAFLGRRGSARDETALLAVEEERERLRKENADQLALLETVINQMPQGGVVIAPPDGRIMLANEQARLRSPWANAEAETIYDSVLQTPRPLEGEVATPEEWAIVQALREGKVTEGRLVGFQGPEGEVLLSIHARPVRDAAGEIIAAVMVHSDVTPEMKAQQHAELLAEEAQRRAAELEAIINSIPEGVIIYDSEGNLLRTNEAMRRLLQYSEVESRLPMAERLPLLHLQNAAGDPVSYDEWPTVVALRGGTVQAAQITIHAGSEREVIALCSGAPLRGPEGDVVGAVLTVTDITMMKRLQEEVEQFAAEAWQQAEDLDTIISSMADGVVVYDAGGQVVRTNQAAMVSAHLKQRQLGTTLPENAKKIVVQDQEGRPVPLERLPSYRALRGETVQSEVTHVKQPDGSWKWFTTSSAPLHDRGGEIVGAVSTFRDITELRAVQEELQRHKEHLEELVARRTQAVVEQQRRLRALASELLTAEQRERQRISTVLHDEVAQPLGAIKLHLSLLRGKHPGGEAELRRLVALTEEATTHTRTIMTQLDPPVLQRLGIVAAVRWWGEVVQERHGLRVVVEAAEEMARFDRPTETAVFQAVRELIQNALKHAQAAEVRVGLHCEAGTLCARVSDDGVGFDPEQVQTTSEGGFGLFSIQERVAYLGGTTVISSAPGQGTEITLRLPGTRSEGASPSPG